MFGIRSKCRPFPAQHCLFNSFFFFSSSNQSLLARATQMVSIYVCRDYRTFPPHHVITISLNEKQGFVCRQVFSSFCSKERKRQQEEEKTPWKLIDPERKRERDGKRGGGYLYVMSILSVYKRSSRSDPRFAAQSLPDVVHCFFFPLKIKIVNSQSIFPRFLASFFCFLHWWLIFKTKTFYIWIWNAINPWQHNEHISCRIM